MIWEMFREALQTVVNLVVLYQLLKPTEKRAEKKPRNRRKRRKH